MVDACVVVYDTHVSKKKKDDFGKMFLLPKNFYNRISFCGKDIGSNEFSQYNNF